MKNKILIFFVVLLSNLSANDNPFSEQNLSIVTPPPFVREDINFSSDARILQSIELKYVKLDGSIESVMLDINKSIDWHETYMLTRSKRPETSQILDVSVTIPEKNTQSADANLSTQNIELPLKTEKIYEQIGYSLYKNKIKLSTKDELISDFSIGNPSKIVLDFKSDKINPTKNIRLSESLFKRIDFGSHKGYYRLVIYLDGKYTYKIDKEVNGYGVSVE